jgi:hypothetical protein
LDVLGLGSFRLAREMGWERLDVRWDALDNNEMNGLEAIDLEEEAKADVSCNERKTRRTGGLGSDKTYPATK